MPILLPFLRSNLARPVGNFLQTRDIQNFVSSEVFVHFDACSFFSHIRRRAMAPNAKRRRSAKELSELERQEEELTASLFGGKRIRRNQLNGDKILDLNDDDGLLDREEGPSSRWSNREEHLEDDQVSA